MRRDVALAWFVVVAFAAAGSAYVANARRTDPPPLSVSVAAVDLDIVSGTMQVDSLEPRSLEPYEGYGTWVDVFDFSPPYTGGNPPLRPDELHNMAAAGVRTVFLQAARLDDRTPDGLEDPWLLAEWLVTAHELGLDVVAWYLPRFGAGADDFERVNAMADFSVLGHRFDGVGIDIEWTGDDIEHDVRSERLIALGNVVTAAQPDLPLGAIVLPPVLIEVVNTDYWPGFPWAEIASDYDVWLPMSYWSFRSDSSGYGDGYAYHEESVRRLRSNVGDPDALVHGIGGIGGIDGIDDPDDPAEPLATIEELDAFARALADTGSIGGSMYDWVTLDDTARARLTELLAN